MRLTIDSVLQEIGSIFFFLQVTELMVCLAIQCFRVTEIWFTKSSDFGD